MPDLPGGAPAWFGWVMFGLLLVLYVSREIQTARSGKASRQKTEAETQKIKLDALRESAEGYTKQIDAIRNALLSGADAIPSEAQIQALEAKASRDLGGDSMAAHLRARRTARTELPDVVDRLMAVKKLEAELEAELSLGVTIPDADIAQLRDSINAVSADLGRLVRLVASSPRIFVGVDFPADGKMRDGDVFIQVAPDDLPPSLGQ